MTGIPHRRTVGLLGCCQYVTHNGLQQTVSPTIQTQAVNCDNEQQNAVTENYRIYLAHIESNTFNILLISRNYHVYKTRVTRGVHLSMHMATVFNSVFTTLNTKIHNMKFLKV